MISVTMRITESGMPVVTSYGGYRKGFTKIERFKRELNNDEMSALASGLKTTDIPKNAFVIKGIGTSSTYIF